MPSSFREFFFDYEPEEQQNIRKATDLRYMKILRFHLMVLNAWPGKEIGENHSKYMILLSGACISFMLICFSTSIYYINEHSDTMSFYELGHTIITMLLGFVSLTRLVTTLPQSTKYRNLSTIFLTKMHLFYYKDVSEYAMKIYRKVNFLSLLFTINMTILVHVGINLFNIIPIWSNYSAGKFENKILYNSTYEQSVYLSLPFKMSTHLNAYIFVSIFLWFVSIVCIMSIFMLDLLLSLIVFNLWGHLKILLHDLETFPLPENKAVLSLDATKNVEMYSKEELEQISQKLKQCMDNHRFITDFTKNMSDTFGPILFVYYGYFQAAGCLLLLECSQMTTKALVQFMPLSVGSFQQLIQTSIIFELIGSTSGRLRDAVYGVPWQYMDTNNRKIVSIFLYNVQKPIHVVALGMLNIGVTTMAAILKTTLSYFAFLRSM